jgi:hypothetical protein
MHFRNIEGILILFNKMRLPLKGIIPPIITPLISNNKIDETGLKNLIEHLISGGVHGIFYWEQLAKHHI